MPAPSIELFNHSFAPCRAPARASPGPSSLRLPPCGCCLAACNWARSASPAAPGPMHCSSPARPSRRCRWLRCSAGGWDEGRRGVAASLKASSPSCRETSTAAAWRQQRVERQTAVRQTGMSASWCCRPASLALSPAGQLASWASPLRWPWAAAWWQAPWASEVAWCWHRCCSVRPGRGGRPACRPRTLPPAPAIPSSL